MLAKIMGESRPFFSSFKEKVPVMIMMPCVHEKKLKTVM